MIIKTSYSTATEPKSDLQITIKNYFFGCYLGSLSSCETFCQCFSWERYPCQISCKTFRSSHPEVLLEKGVLKICSKFTWEHPCRSVISIKLQSNFIEITFRHGCSPVNLLHIFRHLLLRTPLGGCLRTF